MAYRSLPSSNRDGSNESGSLKYFLHSTVGVNWGERDVETRLEFNISAHRDGSTLGNMKATMRCNSTFRYFLHNTISWMIHP